MKFSATMLLLCCGISALAWFIFKEPRETKQPDMVALSPARSERPLHNETLKRLYQRSLAAQHYSKAHGYNTRYCFLMDMQISSGKNRFFVYDMDNNSVAAAGLVAHGDGSDNGSGKLSFSNTPNSHCTSLGKYRIGSSYNGTFGLAYKLYGLDKSNSKAFDRFVVLHAHSCVPDAEVAPARICLSQGCPTVSPVFLRKLRSFIDGSEQPILLWIYD